MKPIPLPYVLVLLLLCGRVSWSEEIALISDPAFLRGFEALGTSPLKQVQDRHLKFSGADGAPAWELGEWWCASSLAEARPRQVIGGGVRYEDKTKFVQVTPLQNGDSELTLGLNSKLERKGVPRKPEEDWPHLLLQQNFTSQSVACPPLSTLERLMFNVEVKIEDTRYEPEGYNPQHHAAQFLLYFTVANRHTGDFLWFGIQFYDDRVEFPGLAVHPADLGSAGLGKYIYSPDVHAFTDQSLHQGDWVRYRADLLPLMKQALESAWKDARLLDSQDLADYHVPYANLGLELPGLHAVKASLRGLSLLAVPSKASGPAARAEKGANAVE